jgi:hypothetical protein
MSADLIKTGQAELFRIGLLDPPADGVFGSVTAWALGASGIATKPTIENAPGILNKLVDMEPWPLVPDDDFAGAMVRAMLRLGHWVCRHPDCVNIIYVEGMDYNGKTGVFKPNTNTPNHFNDLRTLVRINKHGVPKLVDHWQATTEPGKYWTQNPMNPKGAARIAFGQYKAWSRGTHSKSHEALVQTAPVPVYRDKKKSYERYGEVDVGLFGINQHWGYDNSVHDLGRSSAGCLVGRSTAGHKEFMSLVKGDARYKAAGGSYRFMTTIMPAAVVMGA